MTQSTTRDRVDGRAARRLVFLRVNLVQRLRERLAARRLETLEVDVARRPAAAHRERGRAEDFADDGLEGVGRQIRRGGLELHALVGGPDEG